MNQRPFIILCLLIAAGLLVWQFTRSRPAPPAETKMESPLPGPASVPAAPPVPAPTVPKSSSDAAVELSTSAAPGAQPAAPNPSTTKPLPNAPATAESVPAPPEKISEADAQADLEDVRVTIREFHTALGENPVGTNSEIMAAISGNNLKQARIGPPANQKLNEAGELLDRWGTPYFFHQLSKDKMEVRSAGPDRKMWNGDDLVVK